LNERVFLSLFGAIPAIIIITTITVIIIIVVVVVLAVGWQQQLQSEIWRRIVSPAPAPVSTERAPKPVSITNIAAPLSARLPVFGLPALIPFYTDELSIC
jgi:hypothetical protein